MRMIREHPLIAGTAMLALLACARRSVRSWGAAYGREWGEVTGLGRGKAWTLSPPLKFLIRSLFLLPATFRTINRSKCDQNNAQSHCWRNYNFLLISEQITERTVKLGSNTLHRNPWENEPYVSKLVLIKYTKILRRHNKHRTNLSYELPLCSDEGNGLVQI